MFPLAFSQMSRLASVRNLVVSCGVFALLLTASIGRAALISSGTAAIPGTDLFDFDAGVLPAANVQPTADVWWEIMDGTHRALQAYSGGTLVNLGAVDFNTLTPAQLQALTYGTTGIDGSNGTSLLVVGDVFAVHTNQGNYAKALVTTAYSPNLGTNLTIQWETDSVPEPHGIGALAIAAWPIAVTRRRRSPV